MASPNTYPDDNVIPTTVSTIRDPSRQQAKRPPRPLLSAVSPRSAAHRAQFNEEAVSPTSSASPALDYSRRSPATPTTTFKLNVFTAPTMSTGSQSDRQSPARSPRSAFAMASSSKPRSRPSSNRASPVHFDSSGSMSGGPPLGRLPTMNRGSGPGRRQSRFDPMGQDDDAMDDEGYGELGGKHPLRRVNDIKEEGGGNVSLPGIKALFGVAEHPPTPASATSSLYQTPSLPSLGSPSSSPTTVRTSRYSSLNSSISVISETHSHPGWWAPNEDRFGPQAPRSHSFPTQKYADAEEHDSKRRRSDQPLPGRDSEEAARLRWQAGRNASLPSSSSSSGSISGPSGGPLRALLHPPPALSAAASAAMSRGSVSASPTVITPMSASSEFTFERRPSGAPRSASLVGGQLVRSFADLTAADRAASVSEHRGDMAPPPDRRVSMWLPPPNHTEDRSPLPSGMRDVPLHDVSAPHSRSGSLTPNPHLTFPGKASTRPSSPLPDRSSTRRSSLTELIMVKSGDDIAMAASRSHQEPISAPSGQLDRPYSEDNPLWSRRASADSAHSGSSWNHDDGPTPPLRRRKRASLGDAQQLVELHQSNMITEPELRGLDALAESARRVAAEERLEAAQDVDGDEDRGGGAGGPKYACAYCAKTFSRPSSLRIHTYSHTGERPFVCKEPSCRRRFSVQSNLKRHAKVHQLGGAGAGAPIASGAAGSPYPPGTSRSGGAHTPTRHHPPPSGYYPQQGYYPSHEQGQGRYAPYSAGGGPGRRLSNVGEVGARGSREEDWTEEEDLEEDELDEDER